MPTYVYRCSHCDYEFEAVQTMKEDHLVNCPQCHEAALARVIQPGNFILKGSGWFRKTPKDDS